MIKKLLFTLFLSIGLLSTFSETNAIAQLLSSTTFVGTGGTQTFFTHKTFTPYLYSDKRVSQAGGSVVLQGPGFYFATSNSGNWIAGNTYGNYRTEVIEIPLANLYSNAFATSNTQYFIGTFVLWNGGSPVVVGGDNYHLWQSGYQLYIGYGKSANALDPADYHIDIRDIGSGPGPIQDRVPIVFFTRLYIIPQVGATGYMQREQDVLIFKTRASVQLETVGGTYLVTKSNVSGISGTSPYISNGTFTLTNGAVGARIDSTPCFGTGACIGPVTEFVIPNYLSGAISSTNYTSTGTAGGGFNNPVEGSDVPDCKVSIGNLGCMVDWIGYYFSPKTWFTWFANKLTPYDVFYTGGTIASSGSCILPSSISLLSSYNSVYATSHISFGMTVNTGSIIQLSSSGFTLDFKYIGSVPTPPLTGSGYELCLFGNEYYLPEYAFQPVVRDLMKLVIPFFFIIIFIHLFFHKNESPPPPSASTK